MANKPEKQYDLGVKVLLICGLIAIGLIIVCVFFPNVIFGLFM